MKKLHFISLAILGIVSAVSCVEEMSKTDPTALSKNGIAFNISGGASTRAGEETLETTGVVIPFGKSEDGVSLCLEETVLNLDNVGPITRGTPAYTENLGTLYSDLGVHTVGSNYDGDLSYSKMDDQKVGNGWRYQYVYDSSPWKDGSIEFYLHMPATQAGVNAGTDGKKYTYGHDTAQNGTITFSYTSPSEAKDMQDILFGYRSLTQAQYSTFPNGAPVLLRHALTGVKFAIANYDKDKKITIKSVTFNGLKDTGTCTITPGKDDATDFPNNVDVPNVYSSAASVNWQNLGYSKTKLVETTTLGEDGKEVTTTEDVEFSENPSGSFGAPVDFKTGSFKDKGSYPTSFSDAGNLQNLNDENASLTFWFIPQAMTDDITLTIEYTYGSDTPQTGILEFGSALQAANVTWQAGELRTYTIRVDEVNVMITDNVNPTKAEGTVLKDKEGKTIYKVDDDGHATMEPYTFTAYGGTKTDVKIKNTGNTAAYIRVALVGQWLDNSGRPVFGFTDKINNVYLVDSWYQDQFVNHDGVHGYFENLAGYVNNDTNINKSSVTKCPNPCNGWYLCSDGYYYYSEVVEEGATIPNPPFTKYTVGQTPAVVVAGEVKDVYFQLEVATQAVSAKKLNGENYTWKEAWARTNDANQEPTYTEVTVQ